MKRRAGFTIIELLITMTIMVILMALAVVSLRSSQATARDEARKTDVAVIAQQLENYYKSGSDASASTGSYPPTQSINTEAEVRSVLRDLDPKAIRAPGVADTSTMSFAVATGTTAPTPTVNDFIYQPLTASGALCQTTSDECRNFTLFYQLETNATVQTVTSKHQ
jgi:prepilin-type N-terminal cleavage/methylation domain-containing protein